MGRRIPRPRFDWRTLRPRPQILVLWLLLANALGVAALSWVALDGQLAQIAENRAAAEQHALAALAARTESAVAQAVQQPFATLRNQGSAALTAERLRVLAARAPGLSTLLVLDAGLRTVAGAEAIAPERARYLASAVNERILGARLQASGLPPLQLSFNDTHGEPPVLYVFEPLAASAAGPATDAAAAAAPSGWLLLGFDIAALRRTTLDPLAGEFQRQHGVQVTLVPEGGEPAPGTLRVPLGHMLAGWALDARAPAGARSLEGAGLSLATVGAIAALLLLMMLIPVAIYWALRREHALVELRNRFVANVSHELKTPLSLIRMYAETLFLGRLGSPERQHEYHRVILAESERLSRMIEDVLSFSRQREGFTVHRLVATDLRASLAGIVDTYLPEWRARGVGIEAAIDGPPVVVQHDPQALARVVLNLVDNAINYGGSGRSVRIALSAHHHYTRLEVSDEGPGMEADRLLRLRRALRRGQMLAEAEGTGLGLSLVKQIADAHRAQLELQPAGAHGGLSVTIDFPNHAGTP